MSENKSDEKKPRIIDNQIRIIVERSGEADEIKILVYVDSYEVDGLKITLRLKRNDELGDQFYVNCKNEQELKARIEELEKNTFRFELTEKEYLLYRAKPTI